ncbi:MAG: FTR1 family protein [Pseudomonadota bacterium]|nr:FTR1 family protein [Pseudomonadota bacterium]MDE3038471.1 FTR1 family protein [Pseudomonadota bacterium]
MLATIVIVFREIIEAGLVIGIVLAASRGVPRRGFWVTYGIMGGAIGACLVAVFAGSINAAMSGFGQEWFNVTVLLLAVLLLIWHNVWMARHGREIAVQMKAVGEAVARGQRSLLALAIVVGIAVLREGSEIVLFLYGIAVSGGESAVGMMASGAVGLALGAGLSALMYSGLLRIPTRHLFTVTGVLIALLAAGMAAQAAFFLQEAQVITSFDRIMWNSSWLVSDGSIAGKILHTLIGYTARPTEMQLMVYVTTLAIIFTLMRLFGHAPGHSRLAAATLLAFMAYPQPARALDEIYSPNVELGEWSLGYNGSRTFDRNPAKNDAQGHELSLEYGITGHWQGQFNADFTRPSGENAKLDNIGLESRFQFFDQGEYWLDSGLLVSYNLSTLDHAADAIETKLLLQKDTGWLTHTANIGFDQQIGQAARGGPDYVLLWNSRYRMSKYFQPGIEIQGDLGQNGTIGHFNRQEDYLGAAAYGILPGHFNYQLAWLAGVSGAAAQSAARLLVEYETHF